MNGRVQMLTVRTPEGVVFATRLAGPVTRFLAWGVDLLCIMVLGNIIAFVSSLIGFISLDLAQAVTILLLFLVSTAYSIVFEWYWHGQTVGKRMLRLRVVDIEGMRLQPSQVVVRNLLRFVDSLPLFYVVGGITCLFSRHAQRLGDLAANTVVIRMPQLDTPDVEQLLTGKFNSLRQYPHLEARLRQRVSPAEADLALRALMRRDDFEPAERLKLFAELAAHFREIVTFPPEAGDGITDEQYVRNVVETLFRKRGPVETRSTAASASAGVVESGAGNALPAP
jgi:uncharacterized RDD family membrane protein YckC